MKFQKKHIISAALILALGAAVYVNWQFGAQGAQKSSRELGAASYVNATLGSTKDEAVKTSALSDDQKNYFASERTKRQTAQDKIIDRAKEVLGDSSSADEEKTEAQKTAAQIIKNFSVQDSIESIIRAKGFSECLCYISDMGVTVIVPEKELNETAALLIDDAVTSHYNVSYDKISIVGA